ncbi:AraC family transcriptional regulator [Streptomyces sp. Go40/10]|nr:AraC family transcriptional regulator [Streptomyces sp. Go40/10]
MLAPRRLVGITKCRYLDVSNFRRLFQRATGVTPSE